MQNRGNIEAITLVTFEFFIRCILVFRWSMANRIQLYLNVIQRKNLLNHQHFALS